jgi:hypothetical protein
MQTSKREYLKQINPIWNVILRIATKADFKWPLFCRIAAGELYQKAPS